MDLCIECVLRHRSFPRAAELLELLAATHPELAAADSYAELTRDGADDFDLRSGGGGIIHCPVSNHRLNRLEIEGLVATVADADLWLSRLLEDPRFIQARLYDRQYDYWQNATDPVEYQSAGRPMTGLNLKSNGLPHPLAKEIVDVSSNAGRSVLRDGFIESVGSVMWLGDGLWDVLGRQPPDWTTIAALRVDRHRGYVRIQAAERAFSSASEDDLQASLRELIYGDASAA